MPSLAQVPLGGFCSAHIGESAGIEPHATDAGKRVLIGDGELAYVRIDQLNESHCRLAHWVMLSSADDAAAYAEIETSRSVRDGDQRGNRFGVAGLHQDGPHALMSDARCDTKLPRHTGEYLFAQIMTDSSPVVLGFRNHTGDLTMGAS